MCPGPGKPATSWIPALPVFGIQNAASPTGALGSATPTATIGLTKHSWVDDRLQSPAIDPRGTQSALLLHERKPVPSARKLPSQNSSRGSAMQAPSPPPTSVQNLPGEPARDRSDRLGIVRESGPTSIELGCGLADPETRIAAASVTVAVIRTRNTRGSRIQHESTSVRALRVLVPDLARARAAETGRVAAVAARDVAIVALLAGRHVATIRSGCSSTLDRRRPLLVHAPN
jgi:hypothetical protein